MIRLCQIVLFFVSICLHQYSVEATVFSCNATAPCGCSVNDVNINSRIVGGEPAASHSWGWAVSIRASNNRHFCGGTILSSHYILTAAHCVDDPYMSLIELKVAVGTDTLYDSNGQRVVVSKFYKHPSWNSVTKENDIAILKLKKAISWKNKNVARLCLPPTNESIETDFPKINSSLVAIGWGYTVSGGSVSNVLRQVTIQTVGNNERKCSNSIKSTRVQFCAAVDGGGKDTCQGDSGGPLMYYSPELQQWMLAGITSYGHGCGLPDYAGIYTRVTVYVDWIRSIVGTDGVVTAGENSANVGTISNVLFITILSFLTLMHLSK